MNIVRAVMVPHPPILLPAVGRGEEKKIAATTAAYEQAAGFIRQAKPDTIVVLTPHSVLYRDYFHISPGESASGSFAQFGAPGVKLSVRYDAPFVRALERAAAAEKLPAGTLGERDRTLDHAAMIPLWFLQNAYQGEPLPPVVRVGLSGRPLTDHYRLGILLRETAEALGRRIAVIASGDLSHRLRKDGPYGLRPEGPEYDRRIMAAMGSADFGSLFSFSSGFCEAAGECGHRSFTIMAGCFDGLSVQAQRLSYEGPFGVGYGVCLFSPVAPDPARRFLDAELRREEEARRRRRAGEDAYVRLARLAVETYVRGGAPALPDDLPPALRDTCAGAFVSLHLHGELRGCIGTTGPTAPCLGLEILRNAVSACARDPRFPPVAPEELPLLEYSVDVLSPAEDIDTPDALDPRRYGVIVSRGERRGLLLPDLEGVDTVEQQIGIAKKKAGIRPEEAVSLERFEVVRHV
jgi:AmmeMemoRadiSam system protein A